MVKRRLQKHRDIVNERQRMDEQESKDKDEILAIQIAAKDRMECLVKNKRKQVQYNFKSKILLLITYCSFKIDLLPEVLQ